MSILSDFDIYSAMRRGDVDIRPYAQECLGTNSYDVHLARTLLTYSHDGGPAFLDCKDEPFAFELVIPDEGLVLRPGVLYLGVTVEYTETLKHIPFLEGKSSLGRLGLSIHVTAGKGDVGYCGHWTMEMTVIHPLRVYAGMPIGQLIYHEVSSVPVVDYRDKPSQKYSSRPTDGGGFQANPKPVASRMYRNFADGRKREV